MKTVDEIMAQAQVFASTWALINSRFDNGDLLSIANDAKVELRVMVEAALSKQAAHIAELEKHLQFVERWAVHHGSKECTSAESALGVIQHYPPIAEITAGYADGKTPNTFNPFARIVELEAALRMALTQNEHAVLLGLLTDCAAVLRTIDPDDSDEAEKMADLLSAIDRVQTPSRHQGALL